jgi:hypothetical protein
MRRWQRPVQRFRALLGYPLIAVLVAMIIGATVDLGWYGVIPLVVGVPMLVMMWRELRCGIYVGPRGVRVMPAR